MTKQGPYCEDYRKGGLKQGSRVLCSINAACRAFDFTATNRIVGRVTASAIAPDRRRRSCPASRKPSHRLAASVGPDDRGPSAREPNDALMRRLRCRQGTAPVTRKTSASGLDGSAAGRPPKVGSICLSRSTAPPSSPLPSCMPKPPRAPPRTSCRPWFGQCATDPRGDTWSPAEIREMIERKEPFRAHAFEYACVLAGIDRRLTKSKHPWTNGQSLPRRKPGSSA